MAPSPPRTHVLTEWATAACRLAPEDVAFLLAHHRHHVELLPAGRRGRYLLTPRGHVGTIVAPTCRLVLRPKVPAASFFFLLDPDAPPPAVEDRAAPQPGVEALDFLAGRLAQLLAERAAAGLHRDYVEQAACGPFVQGRLDLPAQLRESPARKDRVHSRPEDLSADVPCNQVPRAVAVLVLRSPLLADGPRQALLRALAGFAEVRPVPLGPDCFAAALPPRAAEAYRPLLDLCRLLVDGLAPGETAGATICPAFLLNTERVWERYVTAAVVRAFAGSPRFRVAVQPTFAVNVPTAGQPDLRLRPDLLLNRHSQPWLAADAKWKRLRGSPLVVEDVHQVLAYCAALGVRRGVLIYPGRRDRSWRYDLAHASLRLTVRTLRVVGDREQLEQSRRRLGRGLLR